MDEKKNFPEEFEETPWIYPLIDKGTIDIMEVAERAAKRTGGDPEMYKEVIRLYNEAVMESLKEGATVEYFGMGTLIPELDEEGNLVSRSFEVSEEFEERLNKRFRSNPSFN